MKKTIEITSLKDVEILITKWDNKSMLNLKSSLPISKEKRKDIYKDYIVIYYENETVALIEDILTLKIKTSNINGKYQITKMEYSTIFYDEIKHFIPSNKKMFFDKIVQIRIIKKEGWYELYNVENDFPNNDILV